MADQTPSPATKPAKPSSSPMRFVVPIVLGLVVGSAIYFGYQWWAHRGEFGNDGPPENRALWKDVCGAAPFQ